MGTLNEDLQAIKKVENTLISNKVSKFAYTDKAYANNDANGVNNYDFDQEQNIPNGTATVMQVNETVLTKGWRTQASSLTRMLMNHFLGRISYNLNKVNDNMSNLLSTLQSHLGTANGFASLDENGRIPYSQLPESAIEYKGQWNAQTNTPTLADGTGVKGDFYIVSVAGTQDLGSGNIQFFVNDRVIYDGSVWSRLSAGDVKTVNNIAPVNGNITLTKGDVGLGSVVNTGDSDIPVANGTTKLTTKGGYNLLTSLAPYFSESVTYASGTYVTYQGKFYKCIVAHSGAWNSAHFQQCDIGTDLALTAPKIYSTEEFNTHEKWINGKDIYRKVFNLKDYTAEFYAPLNAKAGGVESIRINVSCKYNGYTYYGGYSGAIIKTNDGVHFKKAFSSFSGNMLIGAMCVHNGKLWFGTTSSSGDGGTLYVTDGENVLGSYTLPTTGASKAGGVESLCSFKGTLYFGAVATTDTSDTTGGLWKVTETNGLPTAITKLSVSAQSSGSTHDLNRAKIKGLFNYNDNVMFIGCDRKGQNTDAIFFTKDGTTFSGFSKGVKMAYFGTFFLYHFDTANKDILYISGDKVFASLSSSSITDLSNITSSSRFSQIGFFTGGSANILYAFTTKNNYIYAISSNGTCYKQSSLQDPTNFSAYTIPVGSSVSLRGGDIRAIDVFNDTFVIIGATSSYNIFIRVFQKIGNLLKINYVTYPEFGAMENFLKGFVMADDINYIVSVLGKDTVTENYFSFDTANSIDQGRLSVHNSYLYLEYTKA